MPPTEVTTGFEPSESTQTDRPRRGRNLDALREMDEAVYRGIADVDVPVADGFLRPLSEAANYSRLWLAIAAVLALVGGSRGRCTALRGVTAVAITSAVTNLVFKNLARRPRPDSSGVADARRLDLPESHSFPSGHTASAFAFASAVSADAPYLLRDGVVSLAALVGFSRVYTGVHYPGDVLAGAVLGWITGRLVRVVMPLDGSVFRLPHR
jgi:membrane-associated phospholipid phosphatase